MGSIRKNKSRRKTLKRKNLIKRTIRKKSNRRKRSTKKITRKRGKQITRQRKNQLKKNKRRNQSGGEDDHNIAIDGYRRCILLFGPTTKLAGVNMDVGELGNKREEYAKIGFSARMARDHGHLVYKLKIPDQTYKDEISRLIQIGKGKVRGSIGEGLILQVECRIEYSPWVETRIKVQSGGVTIDGDFIEYDKIYSVSQDGRDLKIVVAHYSERMPPEYLDIESHDGLKFCKEVSKGTFDALNKPVIFPVGVSNFLRKTVLGTPPVTHLSFPVFAVLDNLVTEAWEVKKSTNKYCRLTFENLNGKPNTHLLLVDESLGLGFERDSAICYLKPGNWAEHLPDVAVSHNYSEEHGSKYHVCSEEPIISTTARHHKLLGETLGIYRKYPGMCAYYNTVSKFCIQLLYMMKNTGFHGNLSELYDDSMGTFVIDPTKHAISGRAGFKLIEGGGEVGTQVKYKHRIILLDHNVSPLNIREYIEWRDRLYESVETPMAISYARKKLTNIDEIWGFGGHSYLEYFWVNYPSQTEGARMDVSSDHQKEENPVSQMMPTGDASMDVSSDHGIEMKTPPPSSMPSESEIQLIISQLYLMHRWGVLDQLNEMLAQHESAEAARAEKAAAEKVAAEAARAEAASGAALSDSGAASGADSG